MLYISYAPEDRHVADLVVQSLEERGIVCWIAPRDIPPGVSCPDAVSAAITASQLMVVVFSAAANASESVAREVERAAAEGIQMLTFRIDDTEPGGDLELHLGPSWLVEALTSPLERRLDELADEAQLWLAADEEPEGAMVEGPALAEGEDFVDSDVAFDFAAPPAPAMPAEPEDAAFPPARPELRVADDEADFAAPPAPDPDVEGAMVEGEWEEPSVGAMAEEDSAPAEPPAPAPAMPAPPLQTSPVKKPTAQRARIVIMPPTGDRKYSAGVPLDAAAAQLVAKLIQMLDLPTTGADGQPISYQLRHVASGAVLADQQMLAAAGLQDGDEVQLVTGAEAGAPSATLDLLDLRLSAFHPKEVVVEEVQRLVAYAHLESAKTEVIRHALETLELKPEEVRAATDTASMPVSRQAEIQVVPQAQGLQFRPSQQFLSLWEDWDSAEFHFRAAADGAGSACNGSVMFLVEGLLIAEVAISVFVRAADAAELFGEDLAEVSASPYRTIFPSHSHRDVEVVTCCERYAAMCGDQYLRDITTLRSGEQWSPRLLELIDQADVFQLFWSDNAAASEYVEQEWRHALGQPRGAAFVRPVYWRQPMVDPPAELGHIHFAFVELPEAPV